MEKDKISLSRGADMLRLSIEEMQDLLLRYGKMSTRKLRETARLLLAQNGGRRLRATARHPPDEDPSVALRLDLGDGFDAAYVREVLEQYRYQARIQLESSPEPLQHVRRGSADLTALQLLQVGNGDPGGVGDRLQRPTMLFAGVSQRLSEFGQHERVYTLLCVQCQL